MCECVCRCSLPSVFGVSLGLCLTCEKLHVSLCVLISVCVACWHQLVPGWRARWWLPPSTPPLVGMSVAECVLWVIGLVWLCVVWLEKSLPIAMQTSELVNSGSLITNPVFVLSYHSIFMVKNDIKVETQPIS